MSDLVENILSENYVSASNIFESRLNEILEKKLVEMKKCIQAEAFGALSKADIEARRRLGWRKASDVLPDPRDYVMKIEPKSKKPAMKKSKKLKAGSWKLEAGRTSRSLGAWCIKKGKKT